MKGQPNRLQDSGSLAGSQIDRNSPLQFTVDGRTIAGFAGDTVLSALLASGVDTAGTHNGYPLALGERFAPFIAPAALAQEVGRALPMQRTPARDGEEFVTLGAHSAGGPFGLFGGARTTLGHRYDAGISRIAPWFDGEADAVLETEIVIVGSGVAGLSAAVAAGQSGSSVILIERRQSLGGDARLFGSIEDEEPPDTIVPRLTTALSHLDNVTILTRTEALSLGHDSVEAHQVLAGEDGISSRRLRITSPRIILASGAAERLPVFSGNRLPGVVGLAEAFDLADRFGVWPGRSSAFNTATSPAYRLAMLALDNGLSVARMSDTRLGPQSRFIEYSKAYGVPLSSGLVPLGVNLHRQGGLEITLSLQMENYARPEPTFTAGRFIVSGGWQPELALWLSAGGGAEWADGRLVATGSLPGIALAGAAAGYRSLSGCAQSGAAAVAAVFGRSAVPIFDIEIDALYESPDAPAFVSRPESEEAPGAYLDAGESLAQSPAVPAPRRFSLFNRPRAESSLAQSAHPVTLGDLAASIALGIVPEAEAGEVARERCIVPRLLPRAAVQAASQANGCPPHLHGRFGPSQAVWRLMADDPRHFEAGNLLYSNTDGSDPLTAVGVILGQDGETGATALVGNGEANARLILRDLSRQVPVRLVEKVG